MKIKKLLLTLLLVPNLSPKNKIDKVILVPNLLTQTKLQMQREEEKFELEKQKEEDNTKLKLALISAAVSLIIVLKGKDEQGISLFEQLLTFLWKK